MSDLDNNKAGDGAAAPDLTKYVPKADYEKVSTTVKDLESKLDDAKMSLLDPEYISFLESKKGKQVEHKVNQAFSFSDDELDKLSSKQLLVVAIERATAAILPEVEKRYEDRLRRSESTLSDVLAIIELQEVEKKYDDFETYRDKTKEILETARVPLTIEQAYLQARGMAPAAASNAPGSEKPSGIVPAGMAPKTFKNKNDAANDAWDQVMGAGKDSI
jgi:hypothetical protein